MSYTAGKPLVVVKLKLFRFTIKILITKRQCTARNLPNYILEEFTAVVYLATAGGIFCKRCRLVLCYSTGNAVTAE